MHIHFVAIGGAGINPLAKFAKLAGYQISGSDQRASENTEKLQKDGVEIYIGSAIDGFNKISSEEKIDWVVYSSAVSMNDQNDEFFKLLDDLNVKHSKRDEFLAHIIAEHDQRMIAIAGTHGKTTTTAMLVWLMTKLEIPANYLLPADVEFSDSVCFGKDNKYLIYEADEFDRNFLKFNPEISLISGVGYDHHEIYPTKRDYNEAFLQFINQSGEVYIYKSDKHYLNANQENIVQINEDDQRINQINLKGLYNRRDGLLACLAVSQELNVPIDKCLSLVSEFPGLHRRMEEIIPNLYTDYAHTPEKIIAAINVATEMANETNQNLVVIYEPLTNRRQVHIKEQYAKVFDGVSKLYWVPSYLAREDPEEKVLTPDELIKYMDNSHISESANLDVIREKIDYHLSVNDFVLCMSGGGAGSLDEWLRENYL